MLQSVHLAQNGDESSALARQKKRLVQGRRPSAADQTGPGVNWTNWMDAIGQPFDVSRIPLSKLEDMRRDPMLAFGLMFVKVPLIRAPWYIKSSDAKRAAFIDGALRRIYGRFILGYCNCLDYGFAPLVKRFEEVENLDWTYYDTETQDDKPVWESKTVKPVIWKPFTTLNPRSVVPHWNYKGEFAGIDFSPYQGISPFGTSGFPAGGNVSDSSKVADIPLDWALWATNEKDSVFGSYWGYPRTGYAVRYWWLYWYEFSLSARAFERWADPPFMVFHPAEDAVDANGAPIDFGAEALGLAESLRSGANISMPSTVIRGLDERQTSVREWWAEQMKSEVNFDALMTKFEYLDVQKLRAIMVPEQALVEGKGGTSSRNVAATFGDVFQESQAVLMEEIDDHINRYMIPQLLEANFGPGGAPCTKVTTGFDPQDLDTMRSIIESVANKTGIDALPVDERELLTRLGVPTMSAREFQKRQEEVAAQAEQQHARSMEAKAGQAGIRTDGSYYNDRDRVVLSGSRPYVVERVDELPLDDSPPAVYDSETRTLFVRKDADVDSVKRFIIGLAEKKDDEQLPTIPDTDVIKEMFQAIDLRLSEANERPINVEVNMPDTPKKTTKIRTDIEYDENDNIVGKIEYEIEGED
jgi:hypothetical protein